MRTRAPPAIGSHEAKWWKCDATEARANLISDDCPRISARGSLCFTLTSLAKRALRPLFQLIRRFGRSRGYPSLFSPPYRPCHSYNFALDDFAYSFMSWGYGNPPLRPTQT